MLRFLVDAQLPPALARKLTAAGHEATHVLDVGLLNASDSRILDYALAIHPSPLVIAQWPQIDLQAQTKLCADVLILVL